MQDAVTIISHALRMLIFETATTVRVLAPALLLVFGAAIGAFLLYEDTLSALMAPTEANLEAEVGNLGGILAIGLVWLLGYTLMAVLWHRHVLLSGMEREAVMRPSPRLSLPTSGAASFWPLSRS